MTVASSARPRYAELPFLPDGSARCSWGTWSIPALGAWNDVDADTVLAAVMAVASGEVLRLDLPQGFFDPPLFGRSRTRHGLRGEDTDFARDDHVDGWNTQASSHWDGFRHVRDTDGYYEGLPGSAVGVEHLARNGLVTRAVLADVAAHRSAVGRPIDPTQAEPIGVDDLQDTLTAQGSVLRQGDVLLVRTGWVAWYRQAQDRRACAQGSSLRAPGLAADAGVAEWLWDSGVVAVAADNPSGEVWPLRTGAGAEARPLHLDLLVGLGIPLGELWDLDALAAASAGDGRYTSLLVSAPLAFPGGCASPANVVVVR